MLYIKIRKKDGSLDSFRIDTDFTIIEDEFDVYNISSIEVMNLK